MTHKDIILVVLFLLLKVWTNLLMCLSSRQCCWYFLSVIIEYTILIVAYSIVKLFIINEILGNIGSL